MITKTISLCILLTACVSGSLKHTTPLESSNPPNKMMDTLQKNIYQFQVAAIDGGTINFATFKGKKILIVNTASQCGFTPQYKELEQLHQQYREHLVIVGFPTNDFGQQEPGDNKEIQNFCTKNYGVSFLMAAKISVKGSEMAPIYQWLTQKDKNGVMNAVVTWNFNKFLLNEEGQLIAKFESNVSPLSEDITNWIRH